MGIVATMVDWGKGKLHFPGYLLLFIEVERVFAVVWRERSKVTLGFSRGFADGFWNAKMPEP